MDMLDAFKKMEEEGTTTTNQWNFEDGNITNSSLGFIYHNLSDSIQPNKVKINFRSEDWIAIDKLSTRFAEIGFDEEKQIEFIKYVFGIVYEKNYYNARTYSPQTFYKDFELYYQKYLIEELKEVFNIDNIYEELENKRAEDYTDKDYYFKYIALCDKYDYPYNLSYCQTDTKKVMEAIKELEKAELDKKEIYEYLDYRFEQGQENGLMKADWLITSGFDQSNYLELYIKNVKKQKKRTIEVITEIAPKYTRCFEFECKYNLNVMGEIGVSAYVLCLNHNANNGIGPKKYQDMNECINSVYTTLDTVYTHNLKTIRLLARENKISLNEQLYRSTKLMLEADHKNNLIIKITKNNETYSYDFGYEIPKFIDEFVAGLQK